MRQRAGFVAPPRTIADITAILDQEKPDPAKRAKAEAEAAAEPPAQAKLSDFYYKRAQARASLGRLKDAAADAAKAVANAADYVTEGSRLELYQESQMRLSGDYRGAIALLERMAQKLNVTVTNKGRAFSINQRTTINLLNLGEVNKAEAYVKRNVALLSEARSWQNAQQFFSNFEAVTEDAKGRLFLVARTISRGRDRLYQGRGALSRRARQVAVLEHHRIASGVRSLRLTTRPSSRGGPRHCRVGTPRRKSIYAGPCSAG